MKSKLTKKQKGFTLMELLIVVAIIGVLSAMVLPRFSDATNKAKSAVDRANIRNVDTQIELYQINTGYFPNYPNMDNIFTSASYFPDGFPKDPFTGNNALGAYTLDMTPMGNPPNLVNLRMRTTTFTHLCASGSCGGFTVTDHPGYTP